MNLSSIAEVIKVQPTVLITGFLGAGKTTLLKYLLAALNKEDIQSDVILNDYADAAIDSETLEEFAESVEPLTATCACCEGLDFLLELSVKSTKSNSDLLFIELNGTADPVPIVESFTLLEEKLRLHPRWQVCVIDVRNFGHRKSYSDIEELQLQTASHIYFSHHHDEIPAEITEKINAINPHASVLDKDALTSAIKNLAKRKTMIATAKPNIVDVSQPKVIAKSDKHFKSHEFTACQLPMPSHASEEEIKTWLNILPTDVIRVKLLIGVSERPKDRYLFERVGSEISKYTQRVRLNNSVPNSAIIIGPDLDIKALEKLADKYLPH